MDPAISIHAPRGGSDCSLNNSVKGCRSISIHAPRGGSDRTFSGSPSKVDYFNPRSPWGERQQSDSASSTSFYFNPRSPWGERPVSVYLWPLRFGFQSTLPVGGATRRSARPTGWAGHFNPRSPWGERQLQEATRAFNEKFQSTLPVGGATIRFPPTMGCVTISIHAPRGGSDRIITINIQGITISIHAPRGGSDDKEVIRCLNRYNFNPRSPWGERLKRHGLQPHLYTVFQSTLPVGGATGKQGGSKPKQNISIHAPRGGSDWR